MYDLTSYSLMAADPVRLEAYEGALREAIDSGRRTVLEIGTGSGFFAVMACKLGAAHVHAVEADDAIQVARELARANGVEDRITFHQARSTDVELPERVDVMFSDLRGILPLWERHLETIRDARERLLRPDGMQVPLVDRIWVAPVHAADIYKSRVTPWGDLDRNIDMNPAASRLRNAYSKARFNKNQLAAPPQLWAEIDYRTVVGTDFSTELAWPLQHSTTVHGFAAWFDTALTDTVGFSNAPTAPKALYGQAFFPLAAPAACEQGDRLDLDLRAHLVSGNYFWKWVTSVGPAGGEPRSRLSQSTLAAAPISPDHIGRAAHDHRPSLAEGGRITAFVLEQMDGSASLAEIADVLRAEFPERFPDPQSAIDRVSELSREYSD